MINKLFHSSVRVEIACTSTCFIFTVPMAKHYHLPSPVSQESTDKFDKTLMRLHKQNVNERYSLNKELFLSAIVGIKSVLYSHTSNRTIDFSLG